jgi:hypothetical protein
LRTNANATGYGGDAYANAWPTPKKNTLHRFIVESPEAEWNAAWTPGTTIMNALTIDDERSAREIGTVAAGSKK